MAIIRIVPAEDLKVIRRYINPGDNVVLITPEIAKEYSAELQDNTEHEYNFGELPDCFVDIVDSTDHYFIESLEENIRLTPAAETA